VLFNEINHDNSHILRLIEAQNGEIDSQIIRDLIGDHERVAAKRRMLYDRFKAEPYTLPVKNRKYPDTTKAKNEIAHNFAKDIIETRIGYLLGNPVAYSLDLSGVDAEEMSKHPHYQAIEDFNIENNIEDLDAETDRWRAITGTAFRYFWVDPAVPLGQIADRVTIVPSWEMITIRHRSTGELEACVRYYNWEYWQNQRMHRRRRVEWIDREKITYYMETETGQYELDPWERENPYFHPYPGHVPVIEIPNNEERKGDFEDVLCLIDEYDRTVSDLANELEEYRLAYLKMKGAKPDKETVMRAKQTGVWGLRNAEDDIDFITKEINIEATKAHLDRLESDIMRLSNSINFSDEKFGGNVTGIAMRYKMQGLESKCKTAERKMSAALRQQYRLLEAGWKASGRLDLRDFSAGNVWFQFKRNYPRDYRDESEASATLKGLISDETRLSLLSFIDSPEFELRKMREEEAARLESAFGPGGLIGGEADVVSGRREESGSGSRAETG
jgi:SPP1 family phage portal protein